MPLFSEDLVVNKDAVDACQGDKQCLFDAGTTGNLELAKASLTINKANAEEVVTLSMYTHSISLINLPEVLTFLYLSYAQIYWVFNGTLNLLFLARFCKTLFLPEFLSNQLEIFTQHSQSCQEGCYDFSKTPIVFFRIIPGFSWSLYSWMAIGSICLLVKWADTAFWLARQLAYNWVHCGWFSIHCQEGEQGALLHPLVSRFDNKNTFIQWVRVANGGPVLN